MAKKIEKTPPTVSDKPLLEKKARNDAPTGEGNTIGEIVGQPPQVTKAPGEANLISKSNTLHEKNFASQAYDNAKKAIVEGGKSVAEMGKGAAKDTWNFGVDIAELAYPAAQMEAARDMEDAARWYEILGNKEQAKVLSEAAEEARGRAVTGNLDELRVTLDNPEQEAGAVLADLNPKGAVKGAVKGIVGAVKGVGKAIEKITAKGGKKTAAGAGQKIEKDAPNVVPKNEKSKENAGNPQEPPEKKGGKVKGVKKTKVPCFSPYDSKRYKKLKTEKERKEFLKEYANQLRRQQDAINNMSPEEFKIAREAYKKNKRNSLAGKAQEDFRNDTKEDIKGNIFDSLINKKVSVKEAEKIAQSRADEIFDGLAALHEPDMVAGGYGQYAPKKMGDKGINSAIGGSWNGKRIKSLDDAAKEAIDSGLGDAKMNVQLELCRGKGKK
ncbi:polymorphic toxin type 15 domain-containing protein [Xenorhabdus sp. XENO-7]|uniref:Polymorphic toxin type 15 domain-containing protein n=1 Tax=Xenorhabdus aichiensis TaxID=3025874 RepID=A0ABT5M9X7_9GAMM|nr:polymorphic toxin type 15 domain-containing protein [Xenorhabdus aichiensis]MDC9623066.1 polymorphic toxin type 15 domain-containing protein [Xenorhabdus aichiensis]